MKDENDHATDVLGEDDFVIKAYTKAELAQLYSPGRELATALQNFSRWMNKCGGLMDELEKIGYNKYRHSFLKREVRLIIAFLGEP